MDKGEAEDNARARNKAGLSSRAENDREQSQQSDSGILSTLLERLADTWFALLTALLAVAAAAFPAIYTLFPTLTQDEGFWKSARAPLLCVWVIFLVYVAYRIARSQLANGQEIQNDAAKSRKQLEDIVSAMNAKLDSWNESANLIRALSEGMTRATADLAVMQRSMNISIAQQEIGQKLQKAATIPVDGVEPLPENSLPVVLVSVAQEPLAQRLLFPSSELTDDFHQSRVFENMLKNVVARLPGDVQSLEIPPSYKSRLPPDWRDREKAMIVPVLGDDGERIGTLIVALAANDLASVNQTSAVLDRCRTMAEDIQPIVARLSRKVSERTLLDDDSGSRGGAQNDH